MSGVHLDLAARTATWWHAAPIGSELERMKSANPGWRVVWAQDRFEDQLERCRGALRFSFDDEATLLAAIERTVTSVGLTTSPVARLSHVYEAEGRSFEANPLALRTDPLQLDAEERARRWDELMRGR